MYCTYGTCISEDVRTVRTIHVSVRMYVLYVRYVYQ